MGRPKSTKINPYTRRCVLQARYDVKEMQEVIKRMHEYKCRSLSEYLRLSSLGLLKKPGAK